MKAMGTDHFCPAGEIQVLDFPMPEPEPDEVRIKVKYAGVNPVDWKILEGHVKDYFKPQFPMIGGWDAAGEIDAVGEEVTKFKKGDQVYAYCRKPLIQWGTWCEYVCVDAKHVAYKPSSISMAEAGSLPLVALTAWQALFEFSLLEEGQTILIHAGAGGVGSIAIQLAKWKGAKVYTTASANHHEYVKNLGADVAIDYKKEDFAEKVKEYEPEGVDVVFDCVGGKTLKKSNECVKEGGVICTITNFSKEELDERGVRKGFVLVRPDGAELKKIADLIDAGKIQAPHVKEYPLEKAAEAMEENKGGHVKGKLVLKIK